MIKRIRQFWRAIKAKLTVEDKVFIDKYLNDEMREIEFINNSRPWENYQTDYKPLVEFAKEKDMYVLASNIPRRIANQYTKVGDYPVVVYVDKTKLKEFYRCR